MSADRERIEYLEAEVEKWQKAYKQMRVTLGDIMGHPMQDTTTENMTFRRSLPQATAPPAPNAFWTAEYGWLVPNE